MDLAYDHIQEDLFTSSDNSKREDGTAASGAPGDAERPPLDLNAEFQETLRAITSNPWGARLGGFWGNVRRQGESYYQEARQEYEVVSEEAIKGFTDLKETIIGRTRSLSLVGGGEDKRSDTNEKGEGATTPTSTGAGTASDSRQDADGEGFISRFRAEAAKRLKDIEKAEDAADEALLKFGTSIRNFLRDAVTIAPPDTTQEGSAHKVLFESKGGDGKRIIHTTRLEAQLHAIHTNLEGLTNDPTGDEWCKWEQEFKVENKTDEIAGDLESYPELRKAMESLVPETVDYTDFWRRYYFLRLAVEADEKKRKELLKATADNVEEIAWDEDSDVEEDSPSTPQVRTETRDVSGMEGSLSTLTPPAKGTLREPRRSNDQQSQADSDASYDLVSGATSRAPGSPKEKDKPTTPSKIDESDEEDWE